MRTVLSVTLGLLVAACSTLTAPPPVVPVEVDPVQALEDKTVALALIRGDGSARAYCSGVWVSPKAILTAAHCVDHVAPAADPENDTKGDPWVWFATKQDVLTSSGAELPRPVLRKAGILVQDDGHDLALLVAMGQTPSHGIAKVSLSNIHPGAKVTTMGHPFGLWWSFSSGDISAVRQMDLDPLGVYVQTTAPTSKGNSGCGLFDKDGNLIGIAHAGIPTGSNLAFYVHGQYVDALLRTQAPNL